MGLIPVQDVLGGGEADGLSPQHLVLTSEVELHPGAHGYDALHELLPVADADLQVVIRR